MRCTPSRCAELTVAAALLACAAGLPPAPVDPPPPSQPRIDGTVYDGWATYYGRPPMPQWSHVHCHLPNVEEATGYGPEIARTIAISADQYAGSAACGMCVEVWGHGRLCPGGVQGADCGLGNAADAVKEKFLAVVTDELWERRYGDIDIGAAGDGHYPVQWRPVPCPWDDKKAVRMTLHAGSNTHYVKVAFRYMDSPMASLEMVRTGEVSNYRFHDNFFVFQADEAGAGFAFDADGCIKFRAVSRLGSTYCGRVDRRLLSEPFEYPAGPC
jgi:hypothetical protein